MLRYILGLHLAFGSVQLTYPVTFMQCNKIVFYDLWLIHTARDLDRDRDRERERENGYGTQWSPFPFPVPV